MTGKPNILRNKDPWSEVNVVRALRLPASRRIQISSSVVHLTLVAEMRTSPYASSNS